LQIIVSQISKVFPIYHPAVAMGLRVRGGRVPRGNVIPCAVSDCTTITTTLTNEFA